MDRVKEKMYQARLQRNKLQENTYWRVHVSGFSSSTEAKSNAEVIKEKPGLKDVWVAKR